MINFGKIAQAPGQIAQAKKIYDIQKKLENNESFVEEGNIKVIVRGGGIMPKFEIKTLEVEGESDKKVIEAINKALKKAFDSNTKKIQEMSGDLQKMMR